MKAEEREFLCLLNPPARLSITETAWRLGFNAADIPVLTAAGLLKPLGHPPQSGSKYFALSVIVKLGADERWLSKACDAIVNYWRGKNASRVKQSSVAQERGD